MSPRINEAATEEEIPGTVDRREREKKTDAVAVVLVEWRCQYRFRSDSGAALTGSLADDRGVSDSRLLPVNLHRPR